MPPPEAGAKPIAHRTRAGLSLSKAMSMAGFLSFIACPVLDKETGKFLKHWALRRHPKLQKIWDRLFANKLGRLCQGIGEGDKDLKQQRVAGTKTYNVIHFHDIPRGNSLL